MVIGEGDPLNHGLGPLLTLSTPIPRLYLNIQQACPAYDIMQGNVER